MARERTSSRKKKMPKKAATLFTQLREDMRALNSSILIISQKMKYLVRNEKILGRNLIVLNKKFKTLEEKILSGAIGSSKGGAGISVEAEAKIENLGKQIIELQAELSSLKNGVASEEQLKEVKYVIDSINPLELATLEQVKELIDEKISRKKKA
jgi:vacuolar-type H+-ATPase subunit I/STV1|tara:strand:- start:150 stop:614 length:465 start_codon:yes stop_codon:yes gene_type:complete